MKKIELDVKKIAEEYQGGESSLTLQNKYRVSYKTIYRALDEAGVDRRDVSNMTKNAYSSGRMLHMKKVWKDSGERWRSTKNPRWKPVGTKRKSHGYVIVKTKNGWVQEHRLIVERIFKRELLRDEIVHHINGIKDDNRKSNLYYFGRESMHRSYHGKKNKPILKSNI